MFKSYSQYKGYCFVEKGIARIPYAPFKMVQIGVLVFLYLWVLFGGGVQAALPPSYTTSEATYARNLNQIATVVMQNYRHKLDEAANKSIKIIHAGLQPLSKKHHYQFETKAILTYVNTDGVEAQQMLHEQFNFDLRGEDAKLIARNTVLRKPIPTKEMQIVSSEKQQGKMYYDLRIFAYQWLDHLSQRKGLKNTLNFTKDSRYKLNIAATHLEGDIKTLLYKRIQHLGTGGHLLRSVESHQIDDVNNLYQLTMIIDWKGINPHNKAMIAKIEQVLILKRNKDGSFSILSVKEEHVLPDTASWEKLLC